MRSSRRTIVVFALILLGAALQPPSSSTVLDEAKARAAAGRRAIFAIFHASWCGWCKQLDRFIQSPEIKPVIQKYFVTVHITVQEQREKVPLNTPGGDELMARLGGPAGLPFFAFLDGQGALIVNSIRPGEGGKRGENIGNPAKPYEIDWFLAMFRKAAPSMTPRETATLERWLRTHKK